MRKVLNFNNVRVLESASIVGKKEAEGPLSSEFDKVENDPYFGEKSWEKAEGRMQSNTAELALKKAGLKADDIDFVVCGDLQDQCFASAQNAADCAQAMLGIYGACSTMSEALLIGSMALSGCFADKVMALTSSHFCAAEKQYRFPLEYGAQRPQTAQWTVTGSGAIILERASEQHGVFITRALVGCPVEMGVTDANNMGAAMAPAACDTISEFLKLASKKPEDYDLILTGDLGKEGSRLLYELLEEKGIDIKKVHNDCGLMIFDLEKQDVHAGGSGCGCSASVVSSYIIKKMRNLEIRKMLYIATGALMSATSALQGEPITGIAHLVEMEAF